MSRTLLKLAALAAISAMPGPLGAQQTPGVNIDPGSYPTTQQQMSPAGALGGGGGGMGAFSGYMPSSNLGMYSIAADRQAPGRDGLPELTDGHTLSADKIDGFNEAVEQNFPMTPQMARRYRDIFEQSERALKERPEPKARVGAAIISLEPGEAPQQVTVAPGIASVFGFYDATGAPWPVEDAVLGNMENFQVMKLGESTNSIALTPLVRFGWTNMIVKFEGHPKPAMVRIEVSETVVDDRLDFQVMDRGPNARQDLVTPDHRVREAGSGVLLSALTGVDMPEGSRRVHIDGVSARGWLLGDTLYIRSRHALLSPGATASMAGPEGIRVYEIAPSSVALFSVDGQVTQANIILP